MLVGGSCWDPSHWERKNIKRGFLEGVLLPFRRVVIRVGFPKGTLCSGVCQSCPVMVFPQGGCMPRVPGLA